MSMSSMLAAWLGVPELLVILVIVLLLFGSTKIPALMRGLGQGINEFKKGAREGDVPKPSEPAPPAAPPVEKK